MTSTLLLGSLVLATAIPLTHVSSAQPGDQHAPGMSIRNVLDAALDVGGISRDGRYGSRVDWKAGGVLVVHDFTTGEVQSITGNEEWATPHDSWAQTSSISPDNKRIAVMWYLGDPGKDFYTLRVCDMDGSNIRVLHEDKDVPVITPFDWSPDGENILVSMALRNTMSPPDTIRKLALVSADDGSVTELKQWTGRRGPMKAEFSPDGKYVAFDLPATSETNKRNIYAIELGTGNEVAVVEHPAKDEFMGWTPDGKRILFASDRTSTRDLWTIEIADGRPVGSPTLVKSDFAGNPVGFSEDGSYYFSKSLQAINVEIATLNETGTGIEGAPQQASTRNVNSTSSSDWSADGRFLAYKMAGNSIGIYSVDTGQERTLRPSMRMEITDHGRLGVVQWAPDGKSVFVSASSKAHGRGTYRIDVETGDTQLIVKLNQPRYPLPTLDGKGLYYVRGFWTLLRRDLATGEDEEIYTTKGKEFIWDLDLSPDGKWLAFPQGDTSIIILPADGGEVREMITVEAVEPSAMGRFAMWTPDGEHLLYSKNKHSELWRVNIETGEQHQIGPTLPYPGLFRATMHPDGKRFAATTVKKGSETWVMEDFLP